LQPRSFVITPTTLSITVRKDVQEIKPESIIGIDRNLRNITIFTPQQTILWNGQKKPSRLWSLKISKVSENYTKKATVREINSDGN
jgi:hypothetical protein